MFTAQEPLRTDIEVFGELDYRATLRLSTVEPAADDDESTLAQG